MNSFSVLSNSLDLAFSPALPWPFLLIAGLILVIFLGLALIWRSYSMMWRILPLLILIGAAANPRLMIEEKRSLPDVVAIMVDQSTSQMIGDRQTQTENTLAALRKTLARIPGLEVHVATLPPAQSPTEGTRLFDATRTFLASLPRQRLAGVIALSDGQLSDSPESLQKILGNVPFHSLISGRKDENDRRLIIENAPSFSLIGGVETIIIRIDDPAAAPNSTASLTLRHNGAAPQTIQAPLNRSYPLRLDITHGGPNVLEIDVEAASEDLSLINNRAVVSVNGIRDRLNVLLISGKPHTGVRTWRNLLKSDAGIDLVHFTILRPADGRDMTPIRELALIVFPMQELFEEKLTSFDLVIFDLFDDSILPYDYYTRLAEYVQQGGALLIAGGNATHDDPRLSAFNQQRDNGLTPVLPALSTGKHLATGFLPLLSQTGQRHPITASLPGANSVTTPQPTWGRWMHQEQVIPDPAARVLMTGASDAPLLIVRRVGEGRIAQLMSDTVWLWSRDFEGGGPYSDLIRRLSHWLMKEPELEEEALEAEVRGSNLVVQRRSLTEEQPTITVTSPDGTNHSLSLTPTRPGISEGQMTAEHLGLYRISDGTHSIVTARGSLDDREFIDLRATEKYVRPLADPTGGGVFWMNEGIPSVRMVSEGNVSAGDTWLGLQRRNSFETLSFRDTPLIPSYVLILLALGGFIWAWWREGKKQ